MFGDKTLNDLTEADFQSLISDGVMESKSIEYKSELSVDVDRAKIKFLSSVAAFANGSGGDLIYGIEEKDGKPVAIKSLPNIVLDKLQLQLGHMIRDGIEPKIYGVEIKDIPVASGGHIVVLRIPKTFSGAHMVIYNNENRFYVRSNNGKVPMDVREIRAAFTLADTTTDRIRRWVAERIGNILADETPCILSNRARTVLHMVPLCAFDPLFKADLSLLTTNRSQMIPINRSGSTHAVDFGGHFCYSGQNRAGAGGYIYAMRNGCIEGVDGDLFTGNNNMIPSGLYEPCLVDFVERGFELLKQVGVTPPVFVFLTVLNANGYTMALPPGYSRWVTVQIKRARMMFPEVFFEGFSTNVPSAMKECFEMLWNECGFARSLSYDEQGIWIDRS